MAVLFAVVAVLLAVTTALATSAWLGSRRQLAVYAPLMDLEAECARVRGVRDGLAAEGRRLEAQLRDERAAFEASMRATREGVALEVAQQRAALQAEIVAKRARWESDYAAALEELGALTQQVETFRAEAELQSFGLYHPVYDYDTPEAYKDALKALRARQAELIKGKQAAVCQTEWTVEGSKAKGRQMTDRNLKLMLRAFNGEADAAIAKVRYDNVTQMIERLRKAFDAINKLGEPNRCLIVGSYLELRLAELRLTHELAERVQAEKETQRQLREQMREEEKAQRELERAQKEAERDELSYQRALDKARAELEAALAARRLESEARSAASEAAQQQLAAQVAELEARLAEAHTNKERALSMAQLTRSGVVYVISNRGSFGEDIYKIGMTRRLEPMDRVRELGDASVPFQFDVHAFIKSDDAPALEAALHRELSERRVNLVNERKEFFHVTLDEIEAVVAAHHPHAVSFTRVIEAEEYRKSLAVRAERLAAAQATAVASADKVVDEARHHFADTRRRLEAAAGEA